MTKTVFDFLTALPIAKKYDLRALQYFLPHALEILKSLIDLKREEKKAQGELSAWDDEFSLTDKDVREEWANRLLKQMSFEEFRSKIILFCLHQQEIRSEMGNGGTKLYCAMRDAAHAILWDRETPTDASRAAISSEDRARHVCNYIAQLITERRRYHDDYEYRWSSYGFPVEFDDPKTKESTRIICRQIVDNRIWLLPDGTFSPTAGHPASPKPLAPCSHNMREIKGLLVGAMARDWISVEEAERVCSLSPLLQPWALLARSSVEISGISTTLPHFVKRLRQRFPEVLDQLLFSEDHPKNMQNGCKNTFDLTNLPDNAGAAFEDFVQQGFNRGMHYEQPLDMYPFPWYVPGVGSESTAPCLLGSAGLLAAARWIAKNSKLNKVGGARFYDHIDALIKQLAFITGVDDDETPDDVVAKLQQFSRPVLLTLLPWCGAAQPLVLRAAKLEALEPLRQWMITEACVDVSDPESSGYNILGNDQEANIGVIDVSSLGAALDGIPAQDVKILINAYTKAGKLPGIDKVLAAFTGEVSRADIFNRAVGKLQQPAMKQLGLLPVIDDADVRERYLTLQKLYKEASKHGAQRQATQRAAASAGLANLAQVAGYRDSSELEWVMESNEGPSVLASLTLRQIGEYQAAIELDGYSANLVIRNAAGKELKSAPASIKNEPVLVELKTALADIRDQFRRFTRLMETRMTSEASIVVTHLKAALAHPVMAPIIGNLVWEDETGNSGLLREHGLEGPAGTQAVCGDALRLVHPVRLLQRPDGAGLLARWQRWLVERQCIQPFKQLFREIYVPTPAELDIGDHSERYAGRPIKTSVAAGLYQARGWISFADDEIWTRSFSEGCTAICGYSAGRYFGEWPEGEVLAMSFQRDGESLPVAEVPPIVFSEAMRDIDLVVTIAMPDGNDDNLERYTSTASVAARTDLLRAIAPVLGEGALEFHERHVLIHGRLADYRVHLASGHVYIEPGAYLCIIPAPDRKNPGVRLPFAEEDFKTAEIVSKVMLLANDHEIKDQSILRQIPKRAG